LAPRKVDFDLKRSIAKKLQKLEKRTNLAISELIRERLNNKDVNQDLVEHVNILTVREEKQSQQDVDSD
jgi:coiled-coil domain-containing protein 12